LESLNTLYLELERLANRVLTEHECLVCM